MEHIPKKRKNRTIPLMQAAALTAVTLFLMGCVQRYISDYDSETYDQVSAIHVSVEQHLTRLERFAKGFDGNPVRPDCEYAESTEFYDSLAASSRALLLRNELRPKNELTSKQIEIMLTQIDEMQSLHAQPDPTLPIDPKSCLSAANLAILRLNLEQTFSAILKLEGAKLRAPSAN